MIRVRLEQVEINPCKILEEVSLPLERENMLAMRLNTDHGMVKSNSLCMPDWSLPDWLLWELVTHAFNRYNFGKAYGACSIRYVSKEEWEVQETYVSALFCKVSAFLVSKLSERIELVEIHLQGLTDFGLAMADRIMGNESVPEEWKELYGNQKYACDCKEDAVFRVFACEGNLRKPSAAVERVVTAEMVNSMNISALTLHQCTENPLIQYLAAKRRSVYIWADEWEKGSGIYGKGLYWT